MNRTLLCVGVDANIVVFISYSFWCEQALISTKCTSNSNRHYLWDVIFNQIWPKFGWSLFWWFETVHQDKLSRELSAPRTFTNTIHESRTKKTLKCITGYLLWTNHTYNSKERHLSSEDNFTRSYQFPMDNNLIKQVTNVVLYWLQRLWNQQSATLVCLQHVSMFSKDVLYTVSIQPKAWPNLDKLVFDHGHCHKSTFFF